MERRRPDGQRRLGLQRHVGLGQRDTAEDEDAVDVRVPELPVVGVARADVEEARDAEAVLGLQVGAVHERAGNLLVEHLRLAEPPRGPVAGAVEGGHVRLALGGRAGRMRDLPLDPDLVLVVAVELEAVGHAVDAEHARRVVVAQPLGYLLELRAAGGREARELDDGTRRREVGRARLVAGFALRRRPLLALGRVLELRRRLVEVRARAGIDDPGTLVVHLAERVLRALERPASRARELAGAAGWGRSSAAGSSWGRRRSRRRPAWP